MIRTTIMMMMKKKEGILTRVGISRAFSSASTSTLANVYRLHHIPTEPITLTSLVKRQPKTRCRFALNTPEFHQWQDENASIIINSAQHLHHQIPIRLASRIVDLESLPTIVAEQKPVVELREMLLASFSEMYASPVPTSLEMERTFMNMQADIRKRHATMHRAISKALDHQSLMMMEMHDPTLVQILDSFYRSRIGIRLMVDQHLAVMHGRSTNHTMPFSSGIISDQCDAMDVVHQTVKETLARFPSTKIHIQGRHLNGFQYIPTNLAIILSEVLKSAIRRSRTTKEEQQEGEDVNLEVFVAGGRRGVCIKVSDSDGALHWHDVAQLWSYQQKQKDHMRENLSYDPVLKQPKNHGEDDNSSSFGLPIARLYARYFGGEITLMPMEGYGCDTYIHLQRLSSST